MADEHLPMEKISVARYQQLYLAGVLDDMRVELLEGWIVEMERYSPRHAATVHIIQNALDRKLPEELATRVKSPVVTHDSEPEPDISVLAGPPSRYCDHHPTTGDVILIVEVADCAIDKARYKTAIYASIGVPAYWMVNLQDRCVEVRTQPEPARRRYGVTAIHRAGDSIEVCFGDTLLARVQVDDLFP